MQTAEQQQAKWISPWRACNNQVWSPIWRLRLRLDFVHIHVSCQQEHEAELRQQARANMAISLQFPCGKFAVCFSCEIKMSTCAFLQSKNCRLFFRDCLRKTLLVFFIASINSTLNIIWGFQFYMPSLHLNSLTNSIKYSLETIEFKRLIKFII